MSTAPNAVWLAATLNDGRSARRWLARRPALGGSWRGLAKEVRGQHPSGVVRCTRPASPLDLAAYRAVGDDEVVTQVAEDKALRNGREPLLRHQIARRGARNLGQTVGGALGASDRSQPSKSAARQRGAFPILPAPYLFVLDHRTTGTGPAVVAAVTATARRARQQATASCRQRRREAAAGAMVLMACRPSKQKSVQSPTLRVRPKTTKSQRHCSACFLVPAYRCVAVGATRGAGDLCWRRVAVAFPLSSLVRPQQRLRPAA